MGDRVEGGTGPQTADTAIMASINCVTFNHANYIRTALDSFLMQKTDFAFEILVHDDASTDGTSSIIREYAARGMEAVNAAGQTSAERLAVQAMDYIRENYSNQDLGLNDICDYLNISTSRFSSLFKEATGRTFTEVLTGVRMERAKQLLRQTSLKNYEIAEKVGFSDPHYFSIAFKKMTGKTPKEYARER